MKEHLIGIDADGKPVKSRFDGVRMPVVVKVRAVHRTGDSLSIAAENDYVLFESEPKQQLPEGARDRAIKLYFDENAGLGGELAVGDQWKLVLSDKAELVTLQHMPDDAQEDK